jgi:hypothetical protein
VKEYAVIYTYFTVQNWSAYLIHEFVSKQGLICICSCLPITYIVYKMNILLEVMVGEES